MKLRKIHLVLLTAFSFALAVLIIFPSKPERRLHDKGTSKTEGFSNSVQIIPDYPHSVGKKSTLWLKLLDLGLKGSEIHSLVSAAKPYFDLNRVSPTMPFRVVMSNELTHSLSENSSATHNLLTNLPNKMPMVVSTDFIKEGLGPEALQPMDRLETDESPCVAIVEFRLSKTRILRLTHKENRWVVDEKKLALDTEVVTFQGVVFESLWNSAVRAKMSPNLIVDMTELFAWQVDFSREVREGDRWRVSVIRKTVSDEFVGWGDIIAAEYINGDEAYKAIRYERDGELVGYFDEEGESLEKMFLKSPIKFGRVSSHFSRRRFHPVRKVYRPHLGVDYAAPRGTPIRSVGDGRIKVIGRRGGAGKMISIRHNSSYKTRYLHLSRFKKGLKQGSRVKQGEIIGFVGSTGLSTGPHLHFEFYEKGRFVDPLKVSFPSAKPVAKKWLDDFKARSMHLIATLPLWRTEIARSETNTTSL